VTVPRALGNYKFERESIESIYASGQCNVCFLPARRLEGCEMGTGDRDRVWDWNWDSNDGEAMTRQER